MISLQQYRMSIGSFNGGKNVKPQPGSESTKCDYKKWRKKMFVFLVMSLFSMFSTLTRAPQSRANHCSNNPFLKTQKQQNKMVHALEGNIRKKGYKLCQWNCGSAFLENKMPEVEAAVARFEPTIFCLSESNLRSTTDRLSVQIPNYQTLTSKTLENPELLMSRVVVYMDDWMRT